MRCIWMRWERNGFRIRRRRETLPEIRGRRRGVSDDNQSRVWRQQPAAFFEEAVLDADGTLAETTGECKQGMDVAYDGTWGYHPLMIAGQHRRTAVSGQS